MNKIKVLELFAGTKSIGKAAEELGYEVLIIWESDYKKNKKLVISKCKEFLYGKMD